MKPSLRTALLTGLSLTLPACSMFGGLSEEERTRLQAYIENSGRYFNGQQYDRAISQSDKGLQLDPGNYKLLTRRAWSYLLWAKPPRNAATTERAARPLRTEAVFARVNEALRGFRELMQQRSFGQHSPQVLLGYGTALFDRGKLELLLAERNAREALATSSADKAQLEERADKHRGRAKALFLLPAAEAFEKIAASDKQFFTTRREAYVYLRRIRNMTGDKPAAVIAGLKALEMIAAERRYWAPQLKSTTRIDTENALRATMRELERSELIERQRLATYYRELEQYPQAIEQYNRVLTARPNDHQEYYHRARCYAALGMKAQARKDFKTFLANGNDKDPQAAVNEATRFVNASR